MGRGVRKLELIKKESVRRSTFKKRKLNLEKKLHELTTLCDVSACMIVCGPKQDVGLEECHVWPENPGELLRAYSDRKQESSHKTFGLSDFYGQRKKKAEEELDTIRRENSEAKYPTRPEILNSLDEAQLRQFAAALKSKAEYVKSRIEIIKRSATDLMGFSELSRSSSDDIREISPENFWARAGTDYESSNDTIYVGGPECPYRHEMLPVENIEDRYYGVDDPVALKFPTEAGEMPCLEPPEDESTRTLYVGVGGLDARITHEQDLRDNFLLPGAIISQLQHQPFQPPGTQNQPPPTPYFNIPPWPHQDWAYNPSMDPQRTGALVPSLKGAPQKHQQEAQLHGHPGVLLPYPPGQSSPPYCPPYGYIRPPVPPLHQLPYQSQSRMAPPPLPPSGDQTSYRQNDTNWDLAAILNSWTVDF